MKLREYINQFYQILTKGQSFSLLVVRLILAYGFYEPALTKWKDFSSVAMWFSEMNIPLPLFTAYMVASFEIVGVVLLTIGFLVRWISIPLISIMITAIITVHWEHGFAACKNGFEIPLYYISFLFILLTFGAGYISFDRLLENKNN